MIEWEIEDDLQEAGCFENGFNGRPAHSDSYGTVLDYTKLTAAYENLKNKYTTEQWKQAIDYWLDNPNCGPPLRLAAKELQRKII